MTFSKRLLCARHFLFITPALSHPGRSAVCPRVTGGNKGHRGEGSGPITSRPGVRAPSLRFPRSTLSTTLALSGAQLYLLLDWPGPSRSQGGSGSEEVQIVSEFERRRGLWVSWALAAPGPAGLQPKPRPEPRWHPSGADRLLGLGSIPGRLQPQGGNAGAGRSASGSIAKGG